MTDHLGFDVRGQAAEGKACAAVAAAGAHMLEAKIVFSAAALACILVAPVDVLQPVGGDVDCSIEVADLVEKDDVVRQAYRARPGNSALVEYACTRTRSDSAEPG